MGVPKVTEQVTNGQALLNLEERIFDAISKTPAWELCVVSGKNGTIQFSDDIVEAGTVEGVRQEILSRALAGGENYAPILSINSGGEFFFFQDGFTHLEKFGYRLAAMSAWCRFMKSLMPESITKGPMGL